MKTLIALMLFSNVAFAQGASFLGLCHPSWDCRGTLQTFAKRQEILVGWLEGSFGKACRCGDAILKSNKRKIIRIHLANGPCLRNRRCGRHEVFYGHTIASASRALEKAPKRLNTRLNKVIERAKERLNGANRLTCLISPVLESDFKPSVRLKWLELAEQHFPGCDIVDNPLKKPCIKGFVCEKHGLEIKAPRPCIADLDGIDGSRINIKQWYNSVRQCDLKFYWEPWMNCIREGKFIDPIDRDCTYKRSRFIKLRDRIWPR